MKIKEAQYFKPNFALDLSRQLAYVDYLAYDAGDFKLLYGKFTFLILINLFKDQIDVYSILVSFFGVYYVLLLAIKEWSNPLKFILFYFFNEFRRSFQAIFLNLFRGMEKAWVYSRAKLSKRWNFEPIKIYTKPIEFSALQPTLKQIFTSLICLHLRVLVDFSLLNYQNLIDQVTLSINFISYLVLLTDHLFTNQANLYRLQDISQYFRQAFDFFIVQLFKIMGKGFMKALLRHTNQTYIRFNLCHKRVALKLSQKLKVAEKGARSIVLLVEWGVNSHCAFHHQIEHILAIELRTLWQVQILGKEDQFFAPCRDEALWKNAQQNSPYKITIRNRHFILTVQVLKQQKEILMVKVMPSKFGFICIVLFLHSELT